MTVLSGCAVRAAIQSDADESYRDFIASVWAVVDDSEEDAKSGDVTIDAANWTRLLRALWDLGERHRERLINLGWAPPESGGQTATKCATAAIRFTPSTATAKKPAAARLSDDRSKAMKIADSTDIELAREAADAAEQDELPTRAACIRACADSAELASELLKALTKAEQFLFDDSGTRIADEDTVLAVRAAIAKATGR